jgi:hypothetical protein
MFVNRSRVLGALTSAACSGVLGDGWVLRAGAVRRQADLDRQLQALKVSEPFSAREPPQLQRVANKLGSLRNFGWGRSQGLQKSLPLLLTAGEKSP